MGPDAFFPVNDMDGVRSARAVCAGCPVAVECLEYALSQGDMCHGIWGGTHREGPALDPQTAGEGTAIGVVTVYADIALHITRPCTCGARLDIESTPADKALREEQRFLERHVGPGHEPGQPEGSDR